MNEQLARRLAKPLILTATLIWGSSFVVMKHALDDIPVFFLLFVRFSAAAALLSLLFYRRWGAVDRGSWAAGGVMGGLIFLAYTAQNVGLMGTTPGKNAFLTAVYCVLVPFLNWLVRNKRPDGYHMAAALLCLLGIGLVSLSADLTVTWGDALTLLSGFFYGLHIIMATQYAQGRDVIMLTVIQFWAAALLNGACMLITGGLPVQAPPAPALWSLAYLTVAATALALLFQNIGQKYTEPASASVLLALEAPFGVLFSVLFYGEQPSQRVLLGFGLIFLAVVCSETKFDFLKKRVDKAAGSAYNALQGNMKTCDEEE